MQQSVQYLERAVSLDPGFAAAGAALWYSNMDLSTQLSAGGKWRMPAGRALLAARRAIDIDAGSAMAHLVIAMHESWWDWKWAEAEKVFRRSLVLNPSSPEAHRTFALMLARTGRLREALDQINEAVDLDPLPES